jgi:outer membrane protein OmpA-like peptidoglycan-associated protein
MAARAGSTGNANLDTIRDAYTKALIPYYGGGTNAIDIQKSFLKAKTDVAYTTTITMLNPTKESFDDYNDTTLQNTIGNGKRVIPNANMGLKGQSAGAASGQTIGDANLLKLRITQGYEPKTPFVGNMMLFMLRWYDDGKDSAKTALYYKPRLDGSGTGYIPVNVDVTLKMQSDAIEPDNPVSSPGQGNNGNPTDPGPGTPPKNPPDCADITCTSTDPTPTNPGGTCTGDNCGPCQAPLSLNLAGDVNFDFDKSTLTAAGMQKLDKLIASAKNGTYKSADISGFTDQIGTDSYNLTLSQARADAVKKYLMDNGFPNIPITAKGYGATNLVVSTAACAGKTGAALQTCYAANRRVIVVVNP